MDLLRAFTLSALGCGVASSACSPESPPIWPDKFVIKQRKIPDSDPSCLANCSTVTTYYDWTQGANLLLIEPDNGDPMLWDLELTSGDSYYFHKSSPPDCKYIAMGVGILTPDWLGNATFLGHMEIDGRPVLGYTKADFIDYYADATDCSPVRWSFKHGMQANFDTLSYEPGETVPDVTMFQPPQYCPNSTKDARSEDGTGAELRMTLCQDKCISGCKIYTMPLHSCYNPQTLFPGDQQWADSDVLDVIEPGQGLNRTFFHSTDGTCTGATNEFMLPLDECVGPFGKPRPWGTFHVNDSL